jgi:hypothetical protein
MPEGASLISPACCTAPPTGLSLGSERVQDEARSAQPAERETKQTGDLSIVHGEPMRSSRERSTTPRRVLARGACSLLSAVVWQCRCVSTTGADRSVVEFQETDTRGGSGMLLAARTRRSRSG